MNIIFIIIAIIISIGGLLVALAGPEKINNIFVLKQSSQDIQQVSENALSVEQKVDLSSNKSSEQQSTSEIDETEFLRKSMFIEELMQPIIEKLQQFDSWTAQDTATRLSMENVLERYFADSESDTTIQNKQIELLEKIDKQLSRDPHEQDTAIIDVLETFTSS